MSAWESKANWKDPKWKYKHWYETDIRETIARVKREMKQLEAQKPKVIVRGKKMISRDDITYMAKEAGFQTSEVWGAIVNGTPITEELKRFANLVAAAKCEELAVEAELNGNTILAQQIRARWQA